MNCAYNTTRLRPVFQLVTQLSTVQYVLAEHSALFCHSSQFYSNYRYKAVRICGECVHTLSNHHCFWTVISESSFTMITSFQFAFIHPVALQSRVGQYVHILDIFYYFEDLFALECSRRSSSSLLRSTFCA